MTGWFVNLSFKSVDNILRYYRSSETSLVSVNFSPPKWNFGELFKLATYKMGENGLLNILKR